MLFFSFSSFTLFPYHQASPSSCHPAPPVVRLRRPWFPLSLPSSLRSGTRAQTQPSTPDPTASLPPTAARRPVHTRCKSAPTCTELYRVCACVCLRACLLAGWIPPQLCTEPRTLKWLLGAGQVDGRAAFLSQVASLPPTAHHPHQAVGTWAPPTSWEVFLESMEMAAQRSDSPQAQVETNGGGFLAQTGHNWRLLR